MCEEYVAGCAPAPLPPLAVTGPAYRPTAPASRDAARKSAAPLRLPPRARLAPSPRAAAAIGIGRFSSSQLTAVLPLAAARRRGFTRQVAAQGPVDANPPQRSLGLDTMPHGCMDYGDDDKVRFRGRAAGEGGAAGPRRARGWVRATPRARAGPPHAQSMRRRPPPPHQTPRRRGHGCARRRAWRGVGRGAPRAVVRRPPVVARPARPAPPRGGKSSATRPTARPPTPRPVPQPAAAGDDLRRLRRRVVVFEARGGADKGPDGHRRDTGPLVAALRARGWAAEALFYTDAARPALTAHALAHADAFLTRINPGAAPPAAGPRPAARTAARGGCVRARGHHRTPPLPPPVTPTRPPPAPPSSGVYEGVTEGALLAMCRELHAAGVHALQHPGAMVAYGAKDALLRLRGLATGLPDTAAYYSHAALLEGLPATLALVRAWGGGAWRGRRQRCEQPRELARAPTRACAAPRARRATACSSKTAAARARASLWCAPRGGRARRAPRACPATRW